MKEWIADGRVAEGTHVWRSDLTRWQPATQYDELHPEIGQVAALADEAAGERMELAGFWPRVGAYLIDAILLNVIYYLIWGASPMDANQANPTTPAELMALLAKMAPLIGLQILVQMAYQVSMNGQFGATLGKMAIGAQIVNLDGSRIGFGKAFLRWLASIVSGLTLGIGYLLVAFRDDRRALHDLLVGTQVIYRR